MEDLVSALDLFKCSRDFDIEDFLRNKAINYEERNWCRTYLIVDEEAFTSGDIKVEAYFTLSHKTLVTPDVISKTLAKKLGAGFVKESIPFVLIGQLGKYISDKYCSCISANEILDYAFEVIYSSHELIPCCNVLVECKDELRTIYENYGFSFFQNDGSYNQFYKIIK